MKKYSPISQNNRLSTLAGLFVSALALLIFTGIANAERQTFSTGITKGQEEINITSEKMTIFSKENKIIFSDNVILTKGDLIMNSDNLEIIMKKQEKKEESKGTEKGIEKAVSYGNVVLTQGETRITSGRAEFNQIDEEIILTENPVLVSDQYQIKGNKIRTLLKENKSIVEKSDVVIKPSEQ